MSISQQRPWSGDFVADQLDVAIHSDPQSAVAVQDLVGLALRRNPKRAHLLVSAVLAKHVPTEPALVMAAGELLGAFVASELALMPDDGGHPRTLPATGESSLTTAAAQLSAVLQGSPGKRHSAIAAFAETVAGLRTVVTDAVVLGYAETATGLGRLVANSLGAYYLHSTRHATPSVVPVAGFEEGHSHATSHALVPTDPHWLDGNGPVILVDDELSTGSTVINTIRELHALVPHAVYVIAALIDLRSSSDRARFDALATELDCKIAVTALGKARVELAPDILPRAAELIQRLQPPASVSPVPAANPKPAGRLSVLELSSEDLTPVRSDRFGNISPPNAADIDVIAKALSNLVGTHKCQGPLVVLGCEENMFLPLAVANTLASLLPAGDVRFSTTTRSPIVALDQSGYAIAGALSFASHDLTHDGPGIRFAYNLNGTGQRPGTIVVFPEPGTSREDVLTGSTTPDRPGAGLQPLGLALAGIADDVVLVLLPVDTPVRGNQPANIHSSIPSSIDTEVTP
ncbi:phosphoribosyltransferase domain-containing protein [Arthrobacter antibioticus]|uniref:phosphoribosyltransferase domain-containing protein n=1 Tax=Arthrobacter sp. H35-MC1 TaxID=3046203 RepID=UPI0024BBCB21|nr:phosphoribosyltransferase domain-containing protein [Arthrobacter sp. H35-MC1]MDJ0316615.1 phosphoribosyltransferase domain-containing protein [Arthrobacter sp. H35-MC1]